MKNLFLLPTDKPSRFVTSKENKKCYLYSIEEFKNIDKFIEYDSKSWDSQNIYITNSKEIKVGEWVIYTKGIKIHCKKLDNKEDVELANIENSGVLKIILTTNQDLILDGVQPIPDEFLEWFVKNPSCEEVEVEKWTDYKLENYKDVPFFKYKIIIPKTTQQIIDEDFAGGLNMGQILPKQEINYSKEEVIKFAKWCAELKVWDNETYVNNTFEELLQQFKNK
jgi:hypothetical protein